MAAGNPERCEERGAHRKTPSRRKQRDDRGSPKRVRERKFCSDVPIQVGAAHALSCRPVKGEAVEQRQNDEQIRPRQTGEQPQGVPTRQSRQQGGGRRALVRRPTDVAEREEQTVVLGRQVLPAEQVLRVQVDHITCPPCAPVPLLICGVEVRDHRALQQGNRDLGPAHPDAERIAYKPPAPPAGHRGEQSRVVGHVEVTPEADPAVVRDQDAAAIQLRQHLQIP